MTLPTTGNISLSQVRTELGRPPGPIQLGELDVRKLFEVLTGPIALSQGRGKSAILSIAINVIGGGGGGGRDAGGGGGGGGHAFKEENVFWINLAEAIQVGQGGGDQQAGGTSSAFGMIATGGRGGGNVFQGRLGLGGVGTGGTRNAQGGQGGGGARGGQSQAASAPTDAGAGITGAGAGGGYSDAAPFSFPGSTATAPAGGGGRSGFAFETGTPGSQYGGGGGAGGPRGGSHGQGAVGAVIVRYSAATQKFTGGSVTFSGGVWTHVFTNNGTLQG